MKTLKPHSERGVALVLTLTMLAVILILLIAFITSTRTERIAAKSYSDHLKAKMMAEAAVEEAVALLKLGTPLQTNSPPTTFWTAPGLALSYTNGALVPVPLYSIGNDPTNLVNLNANSLITGSNSIISANAIYSQWINISTNGSYPDATHPIVGRFAYWVDDEATKVNINGAWARDPSTGTSTNNSALTEVDMDALQPPFDNPAVADAVHSDRTPNLFNTPDEVRRSGSAALIDASGYTANQFYLTAYSADTNVDTWGRERIDLNSLSDPTPAGVAYQRLNENTYRNIYTGWNFLRDTFVEKYGSANLQQILANIIDYRQPAATAHATHDALNGLEIPPTYCGLMKGPFLNEIIVHVMHTNAVTSVTLGPPDITNWTVHVRAFIDVEVINPFSDPVGNGYEILVEPNSISFDLYRGQTNSVHEVNGSAVSYYPTFVSAVGTNTTIGPGPVVTKVLPNVPPRDYMILSNTNGSFTAANWKNAPVWETDVTYTGDGVTANEAPGVTNIIFDVRRVLLRKVPGDPESIQDWATSLGPGSLSDPLIVTNPASLLWKISPLVNVPITEWLARGSGSHFDTNACGLAKNDPRMRTFQNGSSLAATTSWHRTVIASLDPGSPNGIGVTPTGVNASGIFEHKTQVFAPLLLPDGTERVAVPSQATAAPSTFYIKEAPFESPGELGYIHTGVPWKTLRMQSVYPRTNSVVASAASNPLNPLAEVNSVPDWVLLDIFTAGATPTMTGRININATLFGSNDFPRPTVAAPSVLHPRNPSLAALFFGMTSVPLSYPITNSVTPAATNFWFGTTTFAAGAMTQTSPQPSSMDVRSGTNAMYVAWSHDTNIPAAVHNDYWATNAASVASYRYDTNTLFMTPGEILEVNSIDNALVGWGSPLEGPRKADKELIPRKIANLITTRSNAFTIWTTAQAIKDINTNGVYDAGTDLITGEVKVQAVVERYVDNTTSPPTVKFRTKYYRYIYE